MHRLVVDRAEAIANIDRYESELEGSPELRDVMSYARGWLGYRTSEGTWRVAPSKYAGYADNDAATYVRHHRERDGRQTQRALAAWSDAVAVGTAAHEDMMAATLRLFARFGRTPNKLMHMSVMRPVRGAVAATAPSKGRVDPRITMMAGVCGGRPTIRGMRITVGDVLAMLADGASRAEILGDFPYLEDGDISAALTYAAEAAGHRVIRAA